MTKRYLCHLLCLFLVLSATAQTGQIDSTMGINMLSSSMEIRDIKYLSCGKIMACGLREGVLTNEQRGFLGTYDLNGNMLNEYVHGTANTAFACDTLNDTLGIAVCSHRDSVSNLVFITTQQYSINYDLSSFWGFTELEVFDLKTQPDGKFLVAGRAKQNGTNQFFITRWSYSNYGISLDVNFGFEGVALLPLGTDAQARAVDLQTDGKIIVVGNQIATERKGIIMRLLANGQLDVTFNGNGYYQYYFTNGGNYYEYYTVTVSANNDIFCAGATQDGGCLTVVSPNYTSYTKLAVGNAKVFYTSAIGGNQLYLSGPDINYYTQNNAYSCVRLVNAEDFNASYTDTTFSAFYGSNYIISEMDNAIYGSCLQPDGKLLVCGRHNNYGFITRLLTGQQYTGISETTGENGVVLYPNPASTSFTVKGSNISAITIADLSGRTLIQLQGEPTDFQQVDISALLPAVYLVTVNGKHTLKLIKTN